MATSHRESGFGWTDPQWRAEAEAWIRRQCVVEEIEQRHVRPWATVFRVSTPARTVWFKACIPALAYEVALVELLGARRPDCVPRLIASDETRGWMLIEDAGRQLYELEPSRERWEQFMALYAQLQLDVASDAHAMVRAGVPDSRWPQMFRDFTLLLDDERNLRASPEDFVSREQVLALRALLPQLREHAERLEALGLPTSIQHDDLHMWNVFVRNGGYVFLDWGDSCVAHPLLSLYVPLVHADAFDNAGRERIRDAYLEPWTTRAARRELAAAAASAMVLAQITGILKWARIYSGLPVGSRGAFDDVISKRAIDLLAACA